MTTVEIGSDVQGTIDYLKFSVEARGRLGVEPPEGYHYLCLEDFVLQNGQAFPELSPHAGRYIQRPLKACFDNTFQMVSRSRGKLRYVEGYAMCGFFPVHHAWAIDEDERVIDRTWSDPGTGYYGIIVPIDYVRNIRTRDNVCVLDRWQEDYPLLREPFNGF
jgi:hypothetical protein